MAQRITNAMMVNTFTRNLHRNASKMETLQSQLATNKKIVRLSDSPVDVVKILNAKSKQSDLSQFKKNLDDASAWLTQSESAMSECNEILKRCNELAVYASNEVMGVDERAGIAAEVAQLRDQVLTLANSTLGDKYIFGGYNVSSEPFAADPEDGEITHNGVSMISDEGDPEFISYEINFGLDFPVAISGSDLLGVGEENNIYYQLNAFAAALLDENATLETLQPFVDSTQRMQRNLLTQISEVGGRQARIEFMSNRYDQDIINYTKMRSDVEDLDEAEGIMNFSMAEAVYRAALGVGGRVLQPSLIDFLK